MLRTSPGARVDRKPKKNPERMPDVVVIGAGIIGLTTARELQRAGLRVCVLDREQPARGASWAGGGMLTPLPPGLGAAPLQPLLRESLALYPALCSELHAATGIDPEYWCCGLSHVTRSGTIEYPQIAQVRNPRLLKALLAHLHAVGVEIRPHCEVTGLEFEQNRLVAVRTMAGTIPCGRAVICAGAWSAQLAGLPVWPVKGQMLLLRGPPGLLQRIVMNDAVYVIPRRDGRILIGSTLEEAGFDRTPTVAARVGLLEQACGLVSDLRRLPIEDHWAGLRPRPADEAPLIGPDPIKQGLYYNTGHYRLGITLAPASARRLLPVLAEGGLST